jgi:excisionase family DNA binding protein
MPAAFQSIVLTIDDLAEYLKISKSTLYKLAQEGALPGQKIGRHWRFHRDAVDQLLCKYTTGTKTAESSRTRKRPK